MDSKKKTQIATARARHRAHHTRQAAGAAAFLTFAAACGPSLARPDPAPVSATDYVPVTFPPRPPPIEFIPPSPEKGAVWVDGTWDWDGERYGWRAGRWVLPPEGARYAAWTLVRRKEDGQLFFAPSTWKDKAGATLDERTFPRLGPGARARSRPNEGASGGGVRSVSDKKDAGTAHLGTGGDQRSDGGAHMAADAGDDAALPHEKSHSGADGEPD
jgi:hypothetical protein